MALKLVRPGRVVFFYNGDSWEVLGGTPDGWRIWGLGRIYPPPGTYWVELTENATVEHRPTNTGVAIKNQKVVTFKEGEMLLAMYAKKGDALMLTFLAPPPLGLSSFVAAFVRWWRNGFKENSSGTGIRIGCGLVSEEAQGRRVSSVLGILGPLTATSSRVYPCGKSFPPIPVWGYRRENQRYSHNHHRRLQRLCVRHGELPRLTPVGVVAHA